MRPRGRLATLVVLAGVLGCSDGFKVAVDGGSADLPSDGGARDAEPTGDGPLTKDASAADAAPVDAAPMDGGRIPACPGPVFSEDVDDERDPGHHPSIAVGPAGDVHISHYSQGPTPNPFGQGGFHDARYAAYRGGEWQREDIFTEGVLGDFSSIGLGPGGEVHVVYYDYTQQTLLYSRRDASKWRGPEPIAAEAQIGAGSDLTVDAAGTVHVAFPDFGQDRFHYVQRLGGKWQPSVVIEPAGPDITGKPGLAVAPDGTVHVSLVGKGGTLKYVSGKGSSFGAGLVLDTGIGDQQSRSDLALDGAGDVHIAYHDSVSETLKYVGQQSKIFGEPLELDASGSLGQHHAIVADAKTGDLWVAYYHADDKDLRVIRRQAGSWGPPQTIDSAGDVGAHPAAALGPDGALHVAHWNYSGKALRYTRVCR